MQTLIGWLCQIFQIKTGTKQVQQVSAGGFDLFKSHYSPSKGAPSPASANLTISPACSKLRQQNVFQGDYQDLSALVDKCFFAWMTERSDPHNPAIAVQNDDTLIAHLDAVASSELAGSQLIPRVPNVMLELLKRMHQENVSGSELSALIVKDVVLVGAILNEVNSSFYHLSTRINDLSQAILLLGHNRLRMMLAKVSFTPIYNDHLGVYTQHSASKIWEQSQKRALAAYLMARHQKVDPFMAFLAGLMHDVGLTVALRVFDRACDARFKGQLPSSGAFRKKLQRKSLALSARIGAIWSMPEVVIKAIEGQGLDKLTHAKLPLSKVLQRADLLSKICMLIHAGQLTLDLNSVRGILSEAEMDCLLTLIDDQITLASIM